ncbi:hypothetical protein QBC40DRAFT_336515 [Triangularia verruculosa]|uniref:Uncharacterized protein n=1 Tax=Triangularia verruculosa TaxID=2587418 RepID=A0AAN6XQE1_9PEZI|nr:hypothetical protein QBC40DRAFT_336515 [Triangularia verruculosa]
MPSSNRPLTFFSALMVGLNRVLAWVDFGVHYASNYISYLFFGGLKPQTHTRPQRLKDGRVYSPSVSIGLATAIHLSNNGYTVQQPKTPASSRNSTAQSSPAAMNMTKMPISPRFSKGRFTPWSWMFCHQSIAVCLGQITLQVSSTTDNPLIGVVNNAGFCMISPMGLTPDSDVRRIFELDFWAYSSVIRAFLPTIKQIKGRFINIGSFGGYANPPLWAPYCALKAAMEAMTRSWRLELMPFGVGMTTIRPGWTRTGGIGPEIRGAWDGYFDNIPKGAVGVDSFGSVIKTDMPVGDAEEKVYRPMVEKWHKLTIMAADGIAQSSEAVAATVHDVLSDKFLQPYYTVGYDALLGQMASDLTPENIYEYSVAKSFGCL